MSLLQADKLVLLSNLYAHLEELTDSEKIIFFSEILAKVFGDSHSLANVIFGWLHQNMDEISVEQWHKSISIAKKVKQSTTGASLKDEDDNKEKSDSVTTSASNDNYSNNRNVLLNSSTDVMVTICSYLDMKSVIKMQSVSRKVLGLARKWLSRLNQNVVGFELSHLSKQEKKYCHVSSLYPFFQYKKWDIRVLETDAAAFQSGSKVDGLMKSIQNQLSNLHLRFLGHRQKNVAALFSRFLNCQFPKLDTVFVDCQKSFIENQNHWWHAFVSLNPQLTKVCLKNWAWTTSLQSLQPLPFVRHLTLYSGRNIYLPIVLMAYPNLKSLVFRYCHFSTNKFCFQ
ncbi:hypothetical protein RFI_13338 [Reticulomyxa filosa]|uniref:F-box domain-containing protein n=1 Tax=Reticulomyxa filosa TaxID=46433 RepID=X6NDI9_RETFI|nr:hypothetical protein RFI_13338 [Reticulomyxa filosa]|eukprot:ETO23829.1 hypothetical protein RFI_13338 [Reticulomyxa filosa]